MIFINFCESCHDEVEISIRTTFKKSTIKSVEIFYEGREGYCKICNDVVFVGEVHDYNLNQIEKEIKK